LEFFTIAGVKTTANAIQEITVADLDRYCSDIDQVLSVENDNVGTIYCIWGEFTVERQIIKGGLRFSLPDCPNALGWTITTGYDPAPNKIVIHCTINRTVHDDIFIESIESFNNSWKSGIEQLLN